MAQGKLTACDACKHSRKSSRVCAANPETDFDHKTGLLEPRTVYLEDARIWELQLQACCSINVDGHCDDFKPSRTAVLSAEPVVVEHPSEPPAPPIPDVPDASVQAVCGHVSRIGLYANMIGDNGDAISELDHDGQKTAPGMAEMFENIKAEVEALGTLLHTEEGSPTSVVVKGGTFHASE